MTTTPGAKSARASVGFVHGLLGRTSSLHGPCLISDSGLKLLLRRRRASMPVAWVRRSCRQLVSVCRNEAGGMRWLCRIRRIVEAPRRWPSLSSSPWSLTYPQRGFSLAIRDTRSVRTSSIDGRPVRWG